MKEIRQFFNIENDFTPEEETQILEENKWTLNDEKLREYSGETWMILS